MDIHLISTKQVHNQYIPSSNTQLNHIDSFVAKREVDKSDGACLEVPNKTLLPYYIYSKSTNTPSLCTAACAEMGYRFAGVKWSTECWCGDTEPPSSSYTAPAQCNMPCAGDQKIMCGAGSVLNLYRKSKLYCSAWSRSQV